MLDFLADYSLFESFNICGLGTGTIEVIYLFVRNGNKDWYWLGGETPSARAVHLEAINQELCGQWLVHKQGPGDQVPLRVVRVLAKTEPEIKRQMSERRAAREGKLEVGEISPYKVCVTSSSLRQPTTIPLDMLERLEVQ